MNKTLELRARWVKFEGADLEKLKAHYPEVSYEVLYMRPGNEYVDFTRAIFHPEKIAAELDALGIDTFTISGGWSSAQETLATFEELGFKLEGLIKVNNNCDEKVPAFLLRKK